MLTILQHRQAFLVFVRALFLGNQIIHTDILIVRHFLVDTAMTSYNTSVPDNRYISIILSKPCIDYLINLSRSLFLNSMTS